MFKKAILFLIPFLFLLASLLSLFPVWLGDLFSHFRMFWTVFGVILLIIYIILFNQKKIQQGVMLFAIFALGINLYSSFSFWTNTQTYEYLFFGNPIVTEYSEKVQHKIESDTTVKKLLLMNVLSSNTNYEEVKRIIKNTDADFLVILELNQKWETELNQLNQDYPYQFTEIREDNFGMGIYSKTSFIDSDIILNNKGLKEINKYLNEGMKKWTSDINLDVRQINGVELAEPAIFVKNNEGINISIVHPFPPIHVEAYRRRNTYLEQKMSFIKQKRKEKTLLVGDFNCSPFSAHYKEFLKQSGLKDSQENFGFQPTWNSSFPFLMQTQLDHVWHSEKVEILHRQTLPIVGSDHKAVLVFFR
jgi:endonuclease/exonuclease/phosphatase (EEP) superfamily protein YafD